MAPLVIAISGCTSSGKTTLALMLSEIFKNVSHSGIKIVHEDNFFAPKHELPLVTFKSKPSDLKFIQATLQYDAEGDYILSRGSFPTKAAWEPHWKVTGPHTDGWHAIDVAKLVESIESVKVADMVEETGELDEHTKLNSVYPENQADLIKFAPLIAELKDRVKEFTKSHAVTNAESRFDGFNIDSPIASASANSDGKGSIGPICFVEGFLLFADPSENVPATPTLTYDAESSGTVSVDQCPLVPNGDELVDPNVYAALQNGAAAPARGPIKPEEIYSPGVKPEHLYNPLPLVVTPATALNSHPVRPWDIDVFYAGTPRAAAANTADVPTVVTTEDIYSSPLTTNSLGLPDGAPIPDHVTTPLQKSQLNVLFDIKLFLPTSKHHAKKRRFGRSTYIDPPEGGRQPGQMWKAEGYFEDVAWKGYEDAHGWMFQGSDVHADPKWDASGKVGGANGVFVRPGLDDGIEVTVRWAVDTILKELGFRVSDAVKPYGATSVVNKGKGEAEGCSGYIDMRAGKGSGVGCRRCSDVDEANKRMSRFMEECEWETGRSDAGSGKGMSKRKSKLMAIRKTVQRQWVKAKQQYVISGLEGKVERIKTKGKEVWNSTVLGSPIIPTVTTLHRTLSKKVQKAKAKL